MSHPPLAVRARAREREVGHQTGHSPSSHPPSLPPSFVSLALCRRSPGRLPPWPAIGPPGPWALPPADTTAAAAGHGPSHPPPPTQPC